jgi:aspartate carbamoyltransferase catalytic subunit
VSEIRGVGSTEPRKSAGAGFAGAGAEIRGVGSTEPRKSAGAGFAGAGAEIRLINDDLLPPPEPVRRHLLSIADLTRDDVERLLATARSFALSQERDNKKLPTLRGRLILNVFYESSTRTSSSFELAAKRLSADTLTLKSAGSSVDKGESLKDTALTLSAYEPDVIVLRHPAAGAAQYVANVTDARVVNAGDGKHQHPTQALLDLFAMKEALGRLDGLHVAIVGDVAHSRVARSLVQALRLVGADAILVGPPALLPPGLAPTSHDISAIADADVIYVLRMQQERMQPGANFVPSLREYTERWGITPSRVRDGQRVMHPGPMNRGVEIDARVADSDAALVVQQVRSGLIVRMAVLYDLLTTGPVAVESTMEVA